MKTVIAEQPLLLMLMVGVTAAALIYGWLQTGKKEIGIIGVIAAILVPVSWFVSTNWVTDREQIRAIIFETAAAVEANDHDTAVRVIGDEKTKDRARAELNNYTFHSVKVSGVEIRMVSGSDPPAADIDINASIRLSGGQFRNITGYRRLFLKFQKTDDGDWVVVDYHHTQLSGEPDMYSTRRL